MKYIELFKNGFDSTIDEKIKPENGPYVGYSPSEGLRFTIVPEPVVGQPNNEIWYTSENGTIISTSGSFGANIVSNEYNGGKGVITFDGPVTSIGNYAFRWWTSLTSIIIPEKVTSIGENAFNSCSGLTSVTIPNSVTSIGKRAFYDCDALTSVTIPDSVTSIEYETFYGCKSLTSVTIGNSVTSIGDSAFRYCESIISIIIPESVTTIISNAFDACSSLPSISIPNSITNIGSYAFQFCHSLTSITFEGTMEEWNSITKGPGWNYNAPATYVQCSDGQVAL